MKPKVQRPTSKARPEKFNVGSKFKAAVDEFKVPGSKFQVKTSLGQKIEPWKKVGSTPAGDFRIFTIRTDRKISPRTKKPHDFYVIDSVNWVNVIAVTANQELVMVEQYRHGSNTVELEIPGGMMDADDKSPVLTGTRELREETGYAGENARVIGQVFPNPAIMSNVCYTVLVKNCTCCHEVEFDHSEDLITRLVPAARIPTLVAAGKIKHSLVIAALYHYELQITHLLR